MNTKNLMFFSYCLAIFVIMEFFPPIPLFNIIILNMWFILIAFFSRYMNWKFTFSLLLIAMMRLAYGIWTMSLLFDVPNVILYQSYGVIILVSCLWVTYAYVMAKWRIKKKKIYERVGKLK